MYFEFIDKCINYSLTWILPIIILFKCQINYNKMVLLGVGSGFGLNSWEYIRVYSLNLNVYLVSYLSQRFARFYLTHFRGFQLSLSLSLCCHFLYFAGFVRAYC